MYNSNIKIEYLQTLGNTTSSYTNAFKILFNKTEGLESSCSEDIYNIPYDVIIKYVIKNGNVSSLETVKYYYSLVKSYKLWAMDKSYISSDCLFTIDERVDLNKIYESAAPRAKLFKTPEELIEEIEKYIKCDFYVDYITPAELTFYYLLLIYQGLTKEDLVNLKVSDVKITGSNLAILSPQKTIIVYKQFEPYIRKLVTHRTIFNKSNSKSGKFPLNEYLIDNGNDTPRDKFTRVMMRYIDKHVNSFANTNRLYYMGRTYEFFRDGYGKEYNKKSREMYVEYCYNKPAKEVTPHQKNRVFSIYKQWINK